ncbi:hypothetical protein H310_03245 [Aphanomyces invadans]|uniref:Metallo-beta-lactamase domain-containing protein n=1 Tax=Aphanomyces invadans TaxID=157072 RepID=A0A024UHZ9_9STRA|nr:hypothetical protein H310_03245 [Aphanomyces invadans]ETW05482.1 hypothetical protein H310_03245 [Aphanomyces invadans]|eukprot:XP_008865259.1 hypothetical protein H310_03245 [Aphanomyces invadans]
MLVVRPRQRLHRSAVLWHDAVRRPTNLQDSNAWFQVTTTAVMRARSSHSTSMSSKSSIDLYVLGSGPSTSVPSIRCLVTNPNCPVCPEAHANPNSRNRRGNPSLLVKHQGFHILIDCGKTFRESFLRCCVPSEIPPLVDAVVLTHSHADACFGLDDPRDIQRRAPSSGLAVLPVHCSRQTGRDITTQFSYLFPDHTSTKLPSTVLWTSKLQQVHFNDTGVTSFAIQGSSLTFQALPVWHGADYMAHLLDGPPIDVMFLDALHVSQSHPTHMSLPEALQCLERIQPRKAYLVGMGHSIDYSMHQAQLVQRRAACGIDVELAFDGLHIHVDERATDASS